MIWINLMRCCKSDAALVIARRTQWNHRRQPILKAAALTSWTVPNTQIHFQKQENLLQKKQQLYQTSFQFYSTSRFRSAESAVATAPATPVDVATPSSTQDNAPPPILWTTHRLNETQIQKVDAIFHKILWLDLFESHMLNEIINDRMGNTMSSKQRKQLGNLMEQRSQEAAGMASSSSNEAKEEEVEAGPVLVDIKLTAFDAASKIKVIKEVRSILNLGLKEAKEMVESAPVTLQKGIKQDVADQLKAKLEAVGGTIEIS